MNICNPSRVDEIYLVKLNSFSYSGSEAFVLILMPNYIFSMHQKLKF